MRIGELAGRAGVSVRSLRYYEEQGLLAPARSSSGQRRYLEADVERVQFVQRMFGAGLSSRTIIEVLPCVESPSEGTSDATWARLASERDRLDEHIRDLLQTRESLDEIIAINRRHRESLAGTPSPVPATA